MRSAVICLAFLLLVVGCSQATSPLTEGEIRLAEKFNADKKSFVNLGDRYYADRERVYYSRAIVVISGPGSIPVYTPEIEGADRQTFSNLGGGYAKDVSRVYYSGEEFKLADVKSFEYLANSYAKDKNHVYRGSKKIEGEPSIWTEEYVKKNYPPGDYPYHLTTSDLKISFPVTEMIIDRGKSQIVTFGLHNKKESELHYFLNFTLHNMPNGKGGYRNVSGSRATDISDSWFRYKRTGTLKPTEAEIKEIRLAVPEDVLEGSYFFSFEVIDLGSDGIAGGVDTAEDSVYAAKDLFVTVRSK